MSSLPDNRRFPSVANQARVLQPASPNPAAMSQARLAGSSLIKPTSDIIKEPQLILPPILATANDVREVVQYLKKRPDGVDISEVPQPIKKRVFYPPKVTAYESWGIVGRKRDRL